MLMVSAVYNSLNYNAHTVLHSSRMAAVEPAGKSTDFGRTWLGQRATRTKAIPKHTLQGAALEIFDNKERAEVDKIDVKEYQAEVDENRRIKQEKYKPSLPNYLKKNGPIGLPTLI